MPGRFPVNPDSVIVKLPVIVTVVAFAVPVLIKVSKTIATHAAHVDAQLTDCFDFMTTVISPRHAHIFSTNLLVVKGSITKIPSLRFLHYDVGFGS